MRTKVKVPSPELALSRVLDGLGQELIDATDEEVLEAARDLGMDYTTRGSAAFAGLKYPAKPQLADFFEIESAAERIGTNARALPKRKPRRTKRAEPSTHRKDRAGNPKKV